MRTNLLWALAGLLPIVACSTAVREAAPPRFEPMATCFAEKPEAFPTNVSMECGHVIVPEFHDGSGTREIRLGITRLTSGAGKTTAPLVMLAGGPGQTQIGTPILSLFQPALLGDVLKARDIVIMEQRGTKHTDTFLDCPDAARASWLAYQQKLSGAAAESLGVSILRACVDTFVAQGVNLDAYNSVENAADVNAVREALGYARIIYYGASYGSQLGQHVMRDFPDILEGVVLDGAEALSRRSWVEFRGQNAQWGIDNLTALCSSAPKCAAAYNIPELVDRALARFDDGPIPFNYVDPSDSSLVVTGELTAEDMAGLIYMLLNSHYGVYALPSFIAPLTTGTAQEIGQAVGAILGAGLIASRNLAEDRMAILMHFATVCSDDPVHDRSDAKLDGLGKFARIIGEAAVKEYAQACSVVKVRELPASVHNDVRTNVPVLLLSGSLDIATPSFRSQEVADSLPNARIIVFPGTTHVQIAGINRCAARVMTQFVLDPTATLNTECADTPAPPAFVLPDGSTSRE